MESVGFGEHTQEVILGLLASFSSYVTASYSNQVGGGTWYTGSSNATVLPIYSTQSFEYLVMETLMLILLTWLKLGIVDQ